jgi:hypothetical protein
MELFQSLLDNTKHCTVPLDDSQKMYVIQTIQKLDPKGHEIIFFLIRMYHNQQSNEVTFTNPYQAKSVSAGVEFDLLNFPPALQHMIYKFVRLHYELITYETLRK